MYTDPDGELFNPFTLNPLGWLISKAATIGVNYLMAKPGLDAAQAQGYGYGDWQTYAYGAASYTMNVGSIVFGYTAATMTINSLEKIGMSSTLATILGNGTGNAVGSFTYDVSNQAVFKDQSEKIDFNHSIITGLYGFGGGLAAGAVDVSPIAKWDFPMHHTVKHVIRTTAYEAGGSLLSGEPIIDNLTFGLNPGIVIPSAMDVISISSSIIIQRKLNKFNENSKIKIGAFSIDYGLGELDVGNQDNAGRVMNGADEWFLHENNLFSGIGFRDTYGFSQLSSNSLQPLLFIGSPYRYVYFNSIYQFLIKRR